MKGKYHLLIVIGILVVVNVLLALWSPPNARLGYDEEMFAVRDTSKIEAIHIVGSDHTISLERSEKWKLNRQYPVDPDIFGLFTAVFQEIRVSRKIGVGEKDAIRDQGEKLAEATIETNGNTSNFEVYSNATGTQTYFFKENDAYQVEIPGYADQVSSIFRLTPNQWRDRTIFDGNWRTIQEITLDYRTGEDLNIKFSGDFFVVDGIAKIDSNAVVGFLNEFENLRANERIDLSKFAGFDSIAKTDPELLIVIDDIKYQEFDTIRIYSGISGDGLRLVKDTNGEMTVFDERRIDRIMKKSRDFSL